MDDESKIVIKLVEQVALVNKKFGDFAERFRSWPEVAEVQRTFECRKHEAGPLMLEGYVDILLRNGHSIAWLMDVWWDEGHWLITTYVEVYKGEHREKVKEFPDRVAHTFAEFLAQLDRATSDLITSGDWITLAM